jgi:hypothetical protein
MRLPDIKTLEYLPESLFNSIPSMAWACTVTFVVDGQRVKLLPTMYDETTETKETVHTKNRFFGLFRREEKIIEKTIKVTINPKIYRYANDLVMHPNTFYSMLGVKDFHAAKALGKQCPGGKVAIVTN